MLKTRFLKLEAMRREHCGFLSLESCVFEKQVFYWKGKATIIFVHVAFPTPFQKFDFDRVVQFRANQARDFKSKLLARLLPELYSTQSYYHYKTDT